ncbi:hypothetical protein [Candidatus Nitrosotalea sp. TS]|uniref:hypothetical protein n=1 Tax=Candidatus Nitrosotalea sp. TS TaxID=2341020 RepID=UPI00140D47DB|nr:hypothetical protein [Candidatus Nitrosotalea sp. TS]
MSGQEPIEWQIIDKVQETANAYTYTFSAGKSEISIGQFVTIGIHLKRPTASGGVEESFVERAYSIASSPNRDNVELTIKCEKPYGYINPALKKADGFAAYFFEQAKIGDKVKVKFGLKKDHFLSRFHRGPKRISRIGQARTGQSLQEGLCNICRTDQTLELGLYCFTATRTCTWVIPKLSMSYITTG